MTREELKEHCKKTVEQCEMWAIHRGEEPSGKVYEEHKAILDILSQEPCDAISREDARMMLTCEIKDGMTIIEYIKMVDKRLRKLPPVTQKSGHWIPVSERLPEEAFGCLVTILDTDLRTQDEFENILPYTVGYDGETWNNFCGEPIPFEVVAWMKLPAPYQKGGKE